MAIPGVDGATVSSVSRGIAGSADFAQFAETLRSAAELQLGFAEESAITNVILAEAQNIKDHFNKLR